MTTPETTIPRLLTVKDVAKIFGTCDDVITKWVRAGRIPHVRVGWKIMFSEPVLTEWLKQHSSTTDSAESTAVKT